MNETWTKYLPNRLREKITGRPALQKALANTGWLFSDNILRMVLGFFIGVWIARYLGPERYGMLSYALAFVTLFLPLVTLGLDEIAVRNIIRDPSCKDEVLGTAFLLKLAGGLVSLGAATAVVFALRPDDTVSHWLVPILAAGNLFQSFNVIEIWFNSQLQSKYAVLARNAAFLACSALKIALLLSGSSLTAFAAVSALETGIGAAGLVAGYRLRGGRFRAWRATLVKARELLRDSWPLIISFISINIYQRIDQVMLQEMVGSREVGIYAVAVRLVDVWVFIPMAIYWSVSPSIVEARKVSDQLFYQRLQKFYNLVVFLAYAIAIPTTLIAQPLIDTVFGAAYSRAGLMLAGLIWVNVFASLEVARCAFLTTMNWNRLYFVTVFTGCLLNIALCYLLIPRYGAMGAVIASLVAYWFAAHGSCFLFRSLFPTGRMMNKALIYPKIW
jgi:O-antigen/teichoic acid export membrane protein